MTGCLNLQTASTLSGRGVAMRSDAVSQEIYLGTAELTLGDVDDQAVFLEALKQQAEMGLVFCSVLAGHQDVIHIYKHEIQTLADGVHEALKRLSCILEAEWHPEKFVEPKRCDDRSLGHILSSNWDLVVATHKVDLRKDPYTLKVSREILNVGDGVAVRHGGLIEASVISARAPTP